jgi:hypothetical protein
MAVSSRWNSSKNCSSPRLSIENAELRRATAGVAVPSCLPSRAGMGLNKLKQEKGRRGGVCEGIPCLATCWWPACPRPEPGWLLCMRAGALPGKAPAPPPPPCPACIAAVIFPRKSFAAPTSICALGLRFCSRSPCCTAWLRGAMTTEFVIRTALPVEAPSGFLGDGERVACTIGIDRDLHHAPPMTCGDGIAKTWGGGGSFECGERFVCTIGTFRRGVLWLCRAAAAAPATLRAGRDGGGWAASGPVCARTSALRRADTWPCSAGVFCCSPCAAGGGGPLQTRAFVSERVTGARADAHTITHTRTRCAHGRQQTPVGELVHRALAAAGELVALVAVDGAARAVHLELLRLGGALGGSRRGGARRVCRVDAHTPITLWACTRQPHLLSTLCAVQAYTPGTSACGSNVFKVKKAKEVSTLHGRYKFRKISQQNA